jgi:AraC-like DNA-binding protein
LSGGFQQVVLRIDDAALAGRLTALLGDEPAKPLQIAAKSDADLGQELLRRLVFFAAQQIDALGAGLESSPAIRELEQAIIIAFLFANYSDPSGRLRTTPKASAPWQVRVVEEYIAANWNKPIDIATLVDVTGTSARSIFQSFSRARDYSPMLFLKRTRLVQARSRLQAGDSQTSVTAIAYACGFHNLGHFARDYRAAFGELPSETLRKVRRS